MAPDAGDHLPEHLDLEALREAARGCRGCELCKPATQTVFGEGPQDARLMLVGELPGGREDGAGQPFVGPAGRELDQALEAAGVARAEAYSTNDLAPVVIATIHPSAIPRGSDTSAQQAQRELFTDDLRGAAQCLGHV